MSLPALPVVAVMAGLSAVALCVWPKSRSSVKGVALFMAPLAFGFWLIHGGVFASLIGGVVQQTRGLWAFGLWLRIFSIVAASRLWLASSPPPLLIRSLLASSLPASFAFLLASPLLLTEQIKARIAQIQEAQLARGVPVHGSFRERASSLTALLFPLVLGLLNDLPSRSAALDMKAFGLFRRRSSLFGGREPRVPRTPRQVSRDGHGETSRTGESEKARGGSNGGDAPRETAGIAENAESRCASPLQNFASSREYAFRPATAEAFGALSLLALDEARFTAPGAEAPIVTVPALRLFPGEWMLLEGGNGAGKSTLATMLCGGVPEHRSGILSGRAELSGEPVASRTSLQWSPDVQLVQQNPQLSLSGCAFTLYEEVAFGPENLALPLGEIRRRVDDALELFGITHLKEHHPATLSGGEAQKVALASAAAMRPRLLLLDEAFSRIASADVPVLLERLRVWSAKHNTAVLLLERRGQPFERFCDRFGTFLDGVVLERDEETVGRSAAGRSRPEAAPSVVRGDTESFCVGKRRKDEDRPSFGNVVLEQDDSGESACMDRFSKTSAAKEGAALLREERPALLRIRDLDFRWKDRSEPLLRSLNAELRAGERAALVGPNGAGKSTLMRLCAGLLTPERGEALLGGAPVSAMRPKERAARIGFLFQDAERQIFHSTVAEEVLFSLRDEPLSSGERMERLDAALRATGLRGKEKKHPLDLNAAERRMVAVASIAVRGAELLLLDEPSRDFDPQWRELFEEWLRGQSAAVLAISHDPDFVERLFPQVWELNQGRLSQRRGREASFSIDQRNS